MKLIWKKSKAKEEKQMPEQKASTALAVNDWLQKIGLPKFDINLGIGTPVDAIIGAIAQVITIDRETMDPVNRAKLDALRVYWAELATRIVAKPFVDGGLMEPLPKLATLIEKR